MVEPIDKERAKKAHWSSGSGSGSVSKPPTSPAYFLSPSLDQMASSSPGELTPHEDARQERAGERKTDPPGLREKTSDTQSARSAPDAFRSHTLDPKSLQHGYFPPVPIAAVQGREESTQHQQPLGCSARSQQLDGQGVLRKDTVLSPEEKEQLERDREAKDEFADEVWGHAFSLKWVKVAPVPFHRTRHLRNPWNSDREVKVSRDGTEIEPGEYSQREQS